jgi:hypothetical protein
VGRTFTNGSSRSASSIPAGASLSAAASKVSEASHLKTITIAGGVIGALLIIAGVMGIYFLHRHRSHRAQGVRELPIPDAELAVTPFSVAKDNLDPFCDPPTMRTLSLTSTYPPAGKMAHEMQHACANASAQRSSPALEPSDSGSGSSRGSSDIGINAQQLADDLQGLRRDLEQIREARGDLPPRYDHVAAF